MAEKLGYEWERIIIGMRKIRLPFVCGNHGKVDGGRVEDELYARQWDFVPGVEMLRCTAVGLLFYIPQFITLRYVEVASHNLFKTRGLLSALFHLYFVQFDCYLYCPNYAETLSFFAWDFRGFLCHKNEYYVLEFSSKGKKFRTKNKAWSNSKTVISFTGRRILPHQRPRNWNTETIGSS